MSHTSVLRVAGCCLLVMSFSSQITKANVFGSGLAAPSTWDFTQQGPLAITYRLNETASDVRIEIFRAASPDSIIATLAGTTAAGLNTVAWDGRTDAGAPATSANDYRFRVIARQLEGHQNWDDITPSSDVGGIASTRSVDAQGLAAQTDQGNPDFGCIFVNNSQPESTGDFSKQGVYVLTADMAWYGGSAASAYAAGKNDPGNHWDSQDDWSPNKIKIGLDDNCIYVGDSGAYQRSDDLYVSAGTQGGTATPVMVAHGPNHGRIPAAISVGTGAQRVLYGIDRDQGGDAYPDFFRWDIGTTLNNFTGQPTKVFDAKEANPTGTLLWSLRDFDIGTTGDHDAYFANRTYYPNEVRVFRASLDGSRLIWSKTGEELRAMCPSLVSHPYCCAIAVDEDSDRVAVMLDGSATTDSGRVLILRASDGEVVAQWQASPAGDAAVKQGKSLDFDAAGNLLSGSLTDKRVRLWSPPDGPNGYTTTFAGTIGIKNFQPPVPLSAVSRKIHGKNGPFDLLLAFGASNIECRKGGVTTLIVTFDQPVKPSSESVSAGVEVTMENGGTITPTDARIQDSVLTVELPANPKTCYLTISFRGISSLADVPCASALKVAVLTGDANRDGKVDMADLLLLRDSMNQIASDGQFLNDIDCNGIVSLADLIATRSNMNTSVKMLANP